MSSEKSRTWQNLVGPLAVGLLTLMGVVLGIWSTSRTASNEVDATYVNLALTILREPVPENGLSDEGQALRRWAVDVLNETSPVPLNDGLKTAFGSGDLSFRVEMSTSGDAFRCAAGERAVVGQMVICLLPEGSEDGIVTPDGTRRYLPAE